jgi:two-component system, OmpR family, sensor histidine kinase KdpD
VPAPPAGAPRAPGAALRPWALWLAALVAVTAALLLVQPRLDKAHVALVYLLVVLGASSRAGRGLGLLVSVVAFFALNFFFIAPYHTLVVAHPLDWLVLAAFLLTSAVAAQLLSRAQSEAEAARQRAAEVDRLSAVGAEALNAGRAEDALTAIADVVRATLDVARCEIFVRADPDGAAVLVAASGERPPSREAPRPDAGPPSPLPSGDRLVDWVATSGRAVAERDDGSVRVAAADAAPGALDTAGALALYVPLRVRERPVGVLRVLHDAPLALDVPGERFLEALSYYAALGVERLRLVKEAEHAQALREADELKNALLASVSHDLRTPLTTIKALAHAIRVGGDDRAATIEEEADRLNRFVADLLDLSRLAGGAFAVSLELNAAEDLVGAAVQRVSGALAGRTLDVRLDTSEPLLIGRFDFAHSLRALVNLVENAVKYSPPGSTIAVSARRSGDRLELVVEDHGPGVPAGEEARIFEAFYRPPGVPPDVGGAGLGLSIAQRMAAAQGGALRYERRAEGGSRFVLALPAAELHEIDGLSATATEESL